MPNHLRKLLFSILLVGNVSILLDNFKAFAELICSVISAHILFKLWEFTSGYVNHTHLGVGEWRCLFLHWLATLFLLVIVSILVLSWLCVILWTLLRVWSLWDKCRWFSGGTLRIRIQFADVIHVHGVENSWILTVLWFVILNRERYHFLFQLFSCFCLSCCLGIVFLFLWLCSSEFIEYVLIM